EGADMLMVKPALAYLDVIAAIRAQSRLPLVAYNVSGEYSMVKAAAANGWIDERTVVTEVLRSMVRAGSDLVISYHAREALEKGWIAGAADWGSARGAPCRAASRRRCARPARSAASRRSSSRPLARRSAIRRGRATSTWSAPGVR